MTPEQIADAIIAKYGDDPHGDVISIGMRGLYRQEKLGKLRQSYIWEDGNRTRQRLSGTCTIAVTGDYDSISRNGLIDAIANAIKGASRYGDGRIGVVVGQCDTSAICEDANEMVVMGAELVIII